MYYKIYIHESQLILIRKEDISSALFPVQDLVAPFPSKKKFILNYVDNLEKNPIPQVYLLTGEDPDVLFQYLQTCFELIEAAGGLVFNENDEILAIFRKGFWDLPKGKIDPGEDAESAAIREIEEETGAKQLELINFTGKTFHVYRLNNGKRILKQTWWFYLTTQNQLLTPQTEEDIEKAGWMDFNAFLLAEPAYGNIREICSKFKENRN